MGRAAEYEDSNVQIPKRQGLAKFINRSNYVVKLQVEVETDQSDY